uniref:Uncharacterized protein n=1 Tax=Arundo donax TaxID=35708 RepID=A0A0A9EPF8_ARUDO
MQWLPNKNETSTHFEFIWFPMRNSPFPCLLYKLQYVR